MEGAIEGGRGGITEGGNARTSKSGLRKRSTMVISMKVNTLWTIVRAPSESMMAAVTPGTPRYGSPKQNMTHESRQAGRQANKQKRQRDR